MKIVNSQHIFLPVTGGSLRPRILLGQGLVGRLAGSNTTTEAHRTSVITHGLGGPGEEKRKGIKREEEPEEYWKSAVERSGKSPFQDPLAIIGILAIFFPFVLLGIAIAVGLVDLNGGR